MTKDSHTNALDDISRQANDSTDVPQVAFAAFVYDERTDFTHTTEGGVPMVAVLDGLATHVAALAEATGHSVEEVAAAGAEMAGDKQNDGVNEWGGPKK